MDDLAAHLQDLSRGLVALGGATATAALAAGGDDLRASTKSSATDLVTHVDTTVERAVVGALLAARPRDEVLGEEGGTTGEGTSGVRWLLDPVDGTTNLAFGLPQWAVSLAAEVDGEVVAGSVLHVSRGVLYSARRGGGADVDGTPLRCSSTTDLSLALLGTGFPYAPDGRARWGRVAARLLPRVRDVRRLGSAALDLCTTAAGHLDCYAETTLQPWDLAAGGLVAREAGCRVEGLHGEAADERMVLCAPSALFGPLHDAVVQALQEVDGDA